VMFFKESSLSIFFFWVFCFWKWSFGGQAEPVLSCCTTKKRAFNLFRLRLCHADAGSVSTIRRS